MKLHREFQSAELHLCFPLFHLSDSSVHRSSDLALGNSINHSSRHSSGVGLVLYRSSDLALGNCESHGSGHSSGVGMALYRSSDLALDISISWG